MATVGITTCYVPDWADAKTKRKADKINAKIGELAAIGQDIPAKRDALLADTLAGKVTGEDYVRRREELRQDNVRTMVDVDTAALFLAKVALAEELKAAGEVEGQRLDKLAAERRAMLEEKSADFQGRPADREAFLRSDKGIQDYRRGAAAARSAAGEVVKPEDRIWWDGFQLRLRVNLGLPTTVQR
jgi:hypothetical protein